MKKLLRFSMAGRASRPRFVKAHILVILLGFILGVCCPVKAMPSQIEVAQFSPADEGAKCDNGGLKCRKGVSQIAPNINGPVDGVGVKPRQSVEDGTAKSIAGDGSSSFVAVAPSDVTNKASQHDSAKNSVNVRKEGFNHWWWCLYVAIALFPLFITLPTPQKHNKELSGQRPKGLNDDYR